MLKLTPSGTLKAFGQSEIVQSLLGAGADIDELTREFMEVDGLSQREAQALAAIAVQPRPVSEWMSMLAELDKLIDEYCSLAAVSQREVKNIMDARYKQPLATIPDTLEWFRRELAKLKQEQAGT